MTALPRSLWTATSWRRLRRSASRHPSPFDRAAVLTMDGPYMLFVADVLSRHRIAMTDEQRQLFGIDKLNVPRSTVPAITHVDYSARVQTVPRDTNPRYHALISRFKELTGCPSDREHELQCPWRADRLHAERRVPLLHGHGDRGACRRQLLFAQGRPGPASQAGLLEQL